MAGKPRVFVSSTSEFHTLRPRLHARLGRSYEFLDYEQESPGGRIDQRLARLIVTESDVVLGVVGASYGTTCTFAPPPTCRVWERSKKRGASCPVLVGGEGYSIVQWEFSKACEDDLYIIAFLKNLQPEELDEQQGRFFSFLSSNDWTGRFSTEDEALEKIECALIDWRNEFWGPNETEKHEAASKLTWVCLGIAIVCAVLEVLAVGLYLGGKRPWAETERLSIVLIIPMIMSLGFVALKECVESLVEKGRRIL
jgi:hypothetical protein